MFKLTQDLAALTGLSILSLDKLAEKSALAIAHDVHETISAKDPLTVVDIGIGQLYIKLENDIVKYKFIPSANLEQKIRYTLLAKESPLIICAEESLRQRIEQSYKELL